MIEYEKIKNLVKTEWWKEFKKLIHLRKTELAMSLVDNPEKNREKEIFKIKAFEECISIAENVLKKDIIYKKNTSSLTDLPPSI